MRLVLKVMTVVCSALVLFGCATNSQHEGSDDNLGVVQESHRGDIYAQMGQEYIKNGQFAVALNRLQRGLAVDPNNAQIHVTFGQLYERIGQTQLARTHYNRALELEPHNPFFHNAFGAFLCQSGEYSQAAAEFHQALSNPLYNQPWEAQTNMGLCALLAGQHDEGERYLRLALSTNAQVPRALLRLAQLELERGEYATAQEHIVRHEKLVGASPSSLLFGCKAALGLKDKTAANRIKNELIKRFPDAPETQIVRGLVSP